MTDDQIQQWAREAKLYVDDVEWEGVYHVIGDTHRLQAFANLVRNATLEEAATVCMGIALKPSNVILGVAVDCAKEIRSMKS